MKEINNKSKSNKDKTTTVEILPLLSAKEARNLVEAFTPEQELQTVADLIRTRVMAQKYTAQAKELNNTKYIYEKLVNEGFIVTFDTINNLNISWK